MIVRTRTSRRNRRKVQPSQSPLGTNVTSTNTVSSNKWLLTLNGPVIVNALPTGFTVNGAQPTGYSQTSTTTVLLTYAVNVAAGQTFIIPNNSPYIRTPTGGAVVAATGTF